MRWWKPRILAANLHSASGRATCLLMLKKTANIQQAAHDIVMSKAFDNGMICASEQAVIADKEIYKELAEEFKSYGVYFANKKEKAILEEFIFGVTANCANCGGAKLNLR